MKRTRFSLAHALSMFEEYRLMGYSVEVETERSAPGKPITWAYFKIGELWL